MATTAPMLTLVNDASTSRLIKQGAEAKVYISKLFPTPTLTCLDGTPSGAAASSSSQAAAPALIKYRFPKTYRHPSLSSHLTATRTVAEARALVRCARAGVNTPRILCVDEENGILALEVIDGFSVRELLGGGSEGDEVDAVADVQEVQEDERPIPELNEEEVVAAMRLIGSQLARMHQAHIIHGDLTTSNMMLQRSNGVAEIILIDFGLSTNSTWPEDKAVDLYVLERAFSSTHPHSDHLFAQILTSYQHTLETRPIVLTKEERRAIMQQQAGQKGAAKRQAAEKAATSATSWKDVKRKLDEVRLRGRKRSMVG